MTALLSVRDVSRFYTLGRPGLFGRAKTELRAVDGVSFDVEAGTSFGIAGESGSGKSTLARLLLSLEEPSSGSIAFDGQEFAALDATARLAYRRRVQAVFQDTSSSLDPRMRIRDIVAEPLDLQQRHATQPMPKAVIHAAVAEVAGLVGLPESFLARYPHELSGGQKQRVAIARALMLKPSLIVLDEPVSALDVSIRAQILNLLADLQEQFGLAYLMISHDLATLGHFSTRIAIMYLGRVVEIGDTDEIYEQPMHPYTRALFDAVPDPCPGRLAIRPPMRGEIGSALSMSRGCRFCSRCPIARPICYESVPILRATSPTRAVACHAVAEESGAIAEAITHIKQVSGS